jgi:hypothetical protein
MAMSVGARRGGAIAEINVTPMAIARGLRRAWRPDSHFEAGGPADELAVHAEPPARLRAESVRTPSVTED